MTTATDSPTPQIEALRQAFLAGARAFKADVEIYNNPHPFHSDAREVWRKGWLFAAAEYDKIVRQGRRR
jgi:hypothetical protein